MPAICHTLFRVYMGTHITIDENDAIIRKIMIDFIHFNAYASLLWQKKKQKKETNIIFECNPIWLNNGFIIYLQFHSQSLIIVVLLSMCGNRITQTHIRFCSYIFWSFHRICCCCCCCSFSSPFKCNSEYFQSIAMDRHQIGLNFNPT